MKKTSIVWKLKFRKWQGKNIRLPSPGDPPRRIPPPESTSFLFTAIRMRPTLALPLLVLSGHLNGQDAVEWDGKYRLQLSDFRSAATQIGGTTVYHLHSGAGIAIAYHMSNAEFAFTKNFNAKVSCTFNRAAAVLVAPDSATAMDLLLFARFDFDLAELYARKFRKRLHEEKNAFSGAGYITPIYEEIQKSYAERHAGAGKSTDVGRNREELKELHDEVLLEIEQLAGFCKSCKPPKKRN
jgi:hypothetical protein